MGKQHVGGLVFLLLLLTLASPSLAGVARWTPFGPPSGPLQTVAVDAAGNLYAATQYSGVYKSADRGETWSWSGVGMGAEEVEVIAVDPDDGEIYAAGERRFFRSTDAGAHWTVTGRLPAPGENVGTNALALAPGEPDTIFFGRSRELLRSRDEGATWEKVLDTPTGIQAVLVDPNDPQSVFVGTAQPGALLHSADGGATWAPVTEVESFPDHPSDAFSYGVTQLAAAPTTPTTLFAVAGLSLYRSTDAGATWQEIRLSDPNLRYTESIVVVPGPQPRVYSFQQNGVRSALSVSDDLGETWTLVTQDTRGHRLLVQPETGDLVSFDLSGIGIAENEGRSWSFSPLGKLLCSVDEYPLVTPKVVFAGRRTYAVVNKQLYVSRDGGKSWSALARNLAESCVEVTAVAVDPRPGVLWAVGEGIYRSNDGGETWTEVRAVTPFSREFPFRGIVLAGPRTLLAHGCGVWRSVDDGATWKETLKCEILKEEYGEPEFIRITHRLNVDPERPQVVYAGSIEYGERHPPLALPYIYKSENGGHTWRLLADNSFVLTLDPNRPATVYLARPNALLRSLERGRRWQKISNFGLGQGAVWDPARGDIEVDLFDSRILYAGRFDGAWRSGDGGVTWSPLRIGLQGLAVTEIFLDPRRPGRLIVSTTEGLFEGRFAPPPR